MVEAFYNAMHAIGYMHPVHGTQAHMPIGLVIGAFVLDAVAFLLFRWPRLKSISPFEPSKYAAAARLCIILALLFWFSTVAGGILDWQHFYAGAWLFRIKIKMALAGFFFVVLCIAIGVGYKTNGRSKALLGIDAILILTVVTLGLYGGDLAYGIRVPRAPEQYKAGQHVFSFNCVGCHSDGGNNIRPNRPIWGSPMIGSAVTLHAYLRKPVPPMPPFPPSKITDDEVKNLYQYLKHVTANR